MNPNPFKRYPQLWPNAHPERPWWAWGVVAPGLTLNGVQQLPVDVLAHREIRYAWIRRDRRILPEGADIAAFDAANPMPCPPPTLGQMWAWSQPIPHQAMIVGLYEQLDGTPVVTFGNDEAKSYDSWPPDGAILFGGPGAPWVPAWWVPPNPTE